MARRTIQLRIIFLIYLINENYFSTNHLISKLCIADNSFIFFPIPIDLSSLLGLILIISGISLVFVSLRFMRKMKTTFILTEHQKYLFPLAL